MPIKGMEGHRHGCIKDERIDRGIEIAILQAGYLKDADIETTMEEIIEEVTVRTDILGAATGVGIEVGVGVLGEIDEVSIDRHVIKTDLAFLFTIRFAN